MYYENRLPGWSMPSWHWDKDIDRYNPMVRHIYSGGSASYLSALPGILLICRQINDEVTTMLYESNFFKVFIHGAGESEFARLFSPKTRQTMRKILLVLRPMGISYRPNFRMDPHVWDDTLSNISVVAIAAEQPEPPPSHRLPPVDPASVFEEWTVWLTPIFKYLARATCETADIVVDANEEKDTEKVAKEILRGRCRFMPLKDADIIFKRGNYSLESGYWDDDDPINCRDIINDCEYDCYYSD